MRGRRSVGSEERKKLEDKFGREHTYLRISLTERCNLRCVYCMPEEGVELTAREELLTREEIGRLVRLFAREGVEKIRFTGGEPTVRADLADILAETKGTPGICSVGITTNGLTLARRLPAYQEAGLDEVNVSLDTLDPDLFMIMTRRAGHPLVLRGVDKAVELGYRPVKINCVVMRGVNDQEVTGFVDWTREKPVDIRFIEYMPFDGNSWSDRKLIPFAELRQTIERHIGGPLERLLDGPNDTSKSFCVPGSPGRVSFITSMTEHFCGSCNRLRLTADGNLKVCLFGNTEVNLRDLMRHQLLDDDDLLRVIRHAVGRKKFSHAGMYEIAQSKNRPMILIGG